MPANEYNQNDFESITTDGIDVGSSDFIDAGDNIGNYGYGGINQSRSTASSTYSVDELIDIRLQWDVEFQANATILPVLGCRVDPSSDQIDIRVQNLTDGETLCERTGITGNAQDEVVVGSGYTPTTTGSPIRIQTQSRNDDNATSVTMVDPKISFMTETQP